MERVKKYWLAGILVAALIGTGIWGVYQYNEKNDYHTYLDIQFQRQFYDLIGHVENLQTDLAKAMVSGSSTGMVKFLNETVQQSYMAQEKLTQLPFYHGSIRRTEKFLSQLGDYTTAMVNKSLEGILLTPEEMDTLSELHSYANYLSKELITLQQEIVKGGVNFGDLRREGNRNLDYVSEQMENLNLIGIEERMQDYPELIYDGPFSDHIQEKQVQLTGDPVDEARAVQIVTGTFEGLSNGRVVSKIQNGAIESYYITLQRGQEQNAQEVSAAVSVAGGKLIWYLNPRNIGESTLSREEAMEIGRRFLEENDMKGMVPTYAMAAEGEMVINFAFEQGDVIVYSDLIKVKVALDNGEVIGYEAEGFWVNHQERDIPEPVLTEEAAREKLSSAVTVETARLALIPVAGEKEVLCYEFMVSFGADNYLIYIDAADGEQRSVLLMIQQEDGTLVI